MALPNELDFLEDIFNDNAVDRFRSAAWLKSDFDDNVWIYNFDFKVDKVLNWNVFLSNGSALTDSINGELLLSLKYWILVSTDRTILAPVPGYNPMPSMSTMSRDFRAVLRMIDYFLINDRKYQLDRFSFSAIDKDDLTALLDKIYSNKNSSESMFNWSNRVSEYLKKLISNTDISVIDDFINKHPDFKNVDEEVLKDCLLGLTRNEIINARVVMFLNDISTNKVGTGYNNFNFEGVVGLNTKKLSNILYENSIYIKNLNKPSFKSLNINFNNEIQSIREFLPVSVTTKESELLSNINLLEYQRGLRKLQVLNIMNLPSPSEETLSFLKNYVPSLENKKGRFKTLPYELVMKSLRDAIEFHIEYGDLLIDAYCSVVSFAYDNKMKLTSITSDQLSKIIPLKLIDFGVSRIGLTCINSGSNHLKSRGARTSSYYLKLRQNKGLIDLVNVYYGAVKVVVGVITARRDGELLDLNASFCLDNTEEWLVFSKRKSSKLMMGARNIEARPVDPLAVSMIKNLIRLQENLINFGFIDNYYPLFSAPKLNGSLGLNKGNRFSDSYMDLFCDYFETATNSKGERYYLRQHQLRRFFALLFFYSSQVGGVETLQWMLGHTDPEHLWHYITESITGDVLRGAKAQFVAESLHKGAKDYSNLCDFVLEKFNTTEFSIIDVDELEEYIGTLIEEGKATIEPEFFNENDTKKMQIITKVISY